MFCHMCGKQVRDEASFCPYCGTALKQSDAQDTKSTSSVSKEQQRRVTVMKEKPSGPEKSRRGLVIGICVAVIMVGALIAAVILFAGHKSNDKKLTQKIMIDKDYDGAEETTIYVYDSSGLVTEIVQKAENEAYLVVVEYEYDDDGVPIKICVPYDEDGIWLNIDNTDENNEVKRVEISTESYFSDIDTATSQGCVRTIFDLLSGYYKNAVICIYASDYKWTNYYEDGVLRRDYYESENWFYAEEEYVYDQSGNMLSHEANGNEVDDQNDSYEYEDRRIVSMTTDGNTYNFEYDQTKNEEGRTVYTAYSSGITLTYVYDKQGVLRSYTRENEDAKLYYEYDDEGNLIYYKLEVLNNSSSYTTKYSYDGNQDEDLSEYSKKTLSDEEKETTADIGAPEISEDETDTMSYSNVQVGDHITLGTYEQDNDTSNGAEDISWEVLAVEDDRALIISDYGLKYDVYNNEYQEVTWEDCTLREWLDNYFYKSAFSEKERQFILLSDIENVDNSIYGTEGGNDTEDYVFLLSSDEAKKYFSSDSDRMVTSYTGEKRTWWLRSPGKYGIDAAFVGTKGSVDEDGGIVNYHYTAIRPALWLSLNIDISETTEDDASAVKENTSGSMSYGKVQVGDHITLGTYEQDNDTSNGAEDISWEVLAVEDGRALVISDYILAYKPYNEELLETVWETCTLRTWLNDDFYNETFANEEQKYIQLSVIGNNDNLVYVRDGGNNTEDRVFLLSMEEVRDYYGIDEDEFDNSRQLTRGHDKLMVPVSESALEELHQIMIDEYGGTEEWWSELRLQAELSDDTGEISYRCWWLRSPGGLDYSAGFVNDSGAVVYLGDSVSFDVYGVRPAMWINVE